MLGFPGVSSTRARPRHRARPLDVTHAEIGTAVEIGKLDGYQKRLKASVVRFPFYDPDKTRVKA